MSKVQPIPQIDLALAESIARQQAAASTGLESVYWELAAMCINFERDSLCKNGEKSHNGSKSIVGGK